MSPDLKPAAVIFAAGKGSRMKGHNGNKTLLPLIPRGSTYHGDRPILLHILDQLPPGPKAVVVHHQKEDVFRATEHLGLTHCHQPVMNGTGGALLAARSFLKSVTADRVIITMGDVPLVRRRTYESLLDRLQDHSLVVLGFVPKDRRRYGLLDTSGRAVKKIVEWSYRHRLPSAERDRMRICNAGIYAARREPLLLYLNRLQERPHGVTKERNGRSQEIQEYFITDLVELLAEDGLETGYAIAPDEYEVMGVDDPSSLLKAQELFKLRRSSASDPQ